MSYVRRLIAVVSFAVAALASSDAHAQVLGPFRWQLQRYCNVVTVTIVQTGATFRVEGVDDLCGAANQAGVTGVAFQNPNGTIGMSLTTVSPGGSAVHTSATISLATLNGQWQDTTGRAGTFAFNGAAAGEMRTAPHSGLKLLASGTFTYGTAFPARGCLAEQVPWADARVGDIYVPIVVPPSPTSFYGMPSIVSRDGYMPFTLCNTSFSATTAQVSVVMRRLPQ